LASELFSDGAAFKDDPWIGLVLHSSLAISKGCNLEIRPPTDFVAVPMQGLMVITTQWHGELVAHLAPQVGRLRKFKMVGIAG